MGEDVVDTPPGNSTPSAPRERVTGGGNVVIGRGFNVRHAIQTES